MIALVLAAFAVGLDNFAAAVGIGIAGLDTRRRIEVAVVFGLFEGGVPLLGLLLGESVSGGVGKAAQPLGAVLLVATGLYEILQSRREGRATSQKGGTRSRIGLGGRRRLALLVLAGAALSIDNLVVGFALGAYRVALVAAALIMAGMSVTLSLVGLELGDRVGHRLGEAGEFLGGAVLMAVGAAVGAGLH